MKSKNNYAVLAVLVSLALAILACGGGAAATATPAPTNTAAPVATKAPTETDEPTEAPEATEPPDTPEATPGGGIVAGELSIKSLYVYVDDFDNFHVVGEVFNNTEKPATSIELTLAMDDGAGGQVLEDSSSGEPTDSVVFYPLLYTLAQGEGSPFDYSFGADEADTSNWTYEVTVSDFSTGQVDRADLSVENDQVVVDQYGSVILVGELVNNSDSPVLINSFAGGVLDDADTLLATSGIYNVARYLAPAGDANGADRTPFATTIYGSSTDASQTAYYWDADLTQEADYAAGLSLEVVNAFSDEFDRLHVIAVVTNNREEVLNVSFVAGLYDVDGKVVDAATATSPIYVGPGETVPVQLQYFSYVSGDADALDTVDSYTVQIDPYWTFETSYDVVPLETADEDSQEVGDGSYEFTGNMTNTSDQALSYAIIVLSILDADDNLISTDWTSVYPEDESIAPGDELPWTLTIYLPPGTKTEGIQFTTTVQGYVQ